MTRVLPPVSSIAHWTRFIADCRANSLTGSLKVFTNKFVYTSRHAIRRFGKGQPGAGSGWLDSPFQLRGLVSWSPASVAWYVLEDEGTPAAMAKSREEPEEWMMDSLMPGMTVIDIGAHQGRYAIQFARQVGERGLVVAVEPGPRNMALLARNLELNKIHNVHPIQGACWSSREPLQFLPGETLDTSRVSQRSTGESDLMGLPLDDLVEELSLGRVDQLKIDVEGAELPVLEGARKVLREFRPRLFVECHRTLSDLLAWLPRHRYTVQLRKDDPMHGDGFGWISASPDQP